jgi:RNA polymerase sigma-70 factor (ECF subfamily)
MPGHDDEDEGGTFELADEADPPDAIAEQRELRAMVERAIDRIDPEYRVALVLRDVEGFDYETIADLLGVPQGTVKSRIHRARSALREQFKDAVA